MWSFFQDIPGTNGESLISIVAAGAAAATIATALITYFVIPAKYKSSATYGAYLLLVLTTGILVIETGVNASPFIALWMATAVFAGIFGNRTLLALLIGVNCYLASLFVAGTLTRDAIMSILLAGELPIFISYILWHSKSRSEKTKDRAYYDLANELNQVSNKSEVVINAIADGVVAVNSQGVIELINPAAQRIIGWGRKDAIGLDYKSVVPFLDKNGHEIDVTLDPVHETLTTNQSKRTSELMITTNAGKKFAASILVSPIGHLGSGAIIVFRDITKEVAEDKEQAEFVSTASHEMRTPVASIEGYLGLALNPSTATIDDKARDYITKAHEAAQHLGRLFQDLLDVSKADDRRLSNNPKVINAVDFIQNIIEGLEQKAADKGLRIFFKPASLSGGEGGGGLNVSPVFYLYVDADHLRELLSNLIENAIKYTPEGQVTVSVTGDTRHVVFDITDSGIGIPAEDIPHLFQKFYRVDNTDTREIGGTGLGLYLCRRLAEAMDGRLWVESEYKKGSTFFVELPRISHEEANRLIEASADSDSVKAATTVTQSYVSSPKDMSSTAQERAAAVATPIILSHGKASSESTTPVIPQSPTITPRTTISSSQANPSAATAFAPTAAPVTAPPAPATPVAAQAPAAQQPTAETQAAAPATTPQPPLQPHTPPTPTPPAPQAQAHAPVQQQPAPVPQATPPPAPIATTPQAPATQPPAPPQDRTLSIPERRN